MTPKQDKTPEEVMQNLTRSLHAIMPHIAELAHIKRTFYLAYIAEGFTPQEALELSKNISQF